MKVELTIDDDADLSHIDHLMTCLEHQDGFIERVLELLQRALKFTPPATVTLVTGRDSQEVE